MRGGGKGDGWYRRGYTVLCVDLDETFILPRCCSIK